METSFASTCVFNRLISDSESEARGPYARQTFRVLCKPQPLRAACLVSSLDVRISYYYRKLRARSAALVVSLVLSHSAGPTPCPATRHVHARIGTQFTRDGETEKETSRAPSALRAVAAHSIVRVRSGSVVAYARGLGRGEWILKRTFQSTSLLVAGTTGYQQIRMNQVQNSGV